MVNASFITFNERTPQLLGRNMTERTNRLIADVNRAAQQAAQIATRESQKNFTYKRVANAAPRRGRESTLGRFPQKVHWSGTDGSVRLDTQPLEDVPYWIIQEVGTGERAQIRQGGQRRGRGRPRSGDLSIVTVKSQRGRRISNSLAFGTGPTGRYSAPGSAQGQGIYFRRNLKGAPRKPRPIVIEREIQGQHFVQKGAEEGFREYRTSVLAAARRAFAGHPYRP